MKKETRVGVVWGGQTVGITDKGWTILVLVSMEGTILRLTGTVEDDIDGGWKHHKNMWKEKWRKKKKAINEKNNFRKNKT